MEEFLDPCVVLHGEDMSKNEPGQGGRLSHESPQYPEESEYRA
jgi:hypothetical protein